MGCRAHPRSRGENAFVVGAIATVRGSSPLTRGKHLRRSDRRDRRRLIPAHAGKTCPGARSRAPIRAHPRSRGENAYFDWIAVINEGSSPLTRGKQTPLVQLQDENRLIPAHAGKTFSSAATRGVPSAHPRSRGENLAAGEGITLIQGSSPLTRGKPRPAKISALTAGLIPAHAGKTICTPSLCLADGAHPRSRGENRHRQSRGRLAAGSSPLTRGKRCSARGRARRSGLIPAHAGKTASGDAGDGSQRAHPRSRGENLAR